MEEQIRALRTLVRDSRVTRQQLINAIVETIPAIKVHLDRTRLLFCVWWDLRRGKRIDYLERLIAK